MYFSLDKAETRASIPSAVSLRQPDRSSVSRSLKVPILDRALKMNDRFRLLFG